MYSVYFKFSSTHKIWPTIYILSLQFALQPEFWYHLFFNQNLFSFKLTCDIELIMMLNKLFTFPKLDGNFLTLEPLGNMHVSFQSWQSIHQTHHTTILTQYIYSIICYCCYIIYYAKPTYVNNHLLLCYIDCLNLKYIKKTV